MRIANNTEREKFKAHYCKNEKSRITIIKKFIVEIESFEDLLPNKKISSYGTGNRDIEGSFIMFKVFDLENGIEYYPVFSESIGRKMINEWKKDIPPKRSIFTNTNSSKESCKTSSEIKHNNRDNRKLRDLILFVRSLMILHIDNPKPLNGGLKEIYSTLDSNHTLEVEPYQIKSVNTALKNFLDKKINTDNDNFKNLNDYLDYLRNTTKRNLKSTEFDNLKKIMINKYPDEQIYF